MNLTSVPPVIRDHMGFLMFAHNGRFSASVKVNGQRHFARDYKDRAVTLVAQDDGMVEPGDGEFARAMGWK